MKRALVLLLIANVAAAAPVVVGDGDPRWQLDLGDDWQKEAPAETPGGTVLASYKRTIGWRLVVARQRGNTDAAYDGDKTFFAGLEDGVRRDTTGYKKLSARQRTVTRKKLKIPVYDLWYRSRGGVRGSRFFIMKGYAVVATIDVPRGRKVDGAARRVLESLTPVW